MVDEKFPRILPRTTGITRKKEDEGAGRGS
jgi:hypothetical protein